MCCVWTSFFAGYEKSYKLFLLSWFYFFPGIPFFLFLFSFVWSPLNSGRRQRWGSLLGPLTFYPHSPPPTFHPRTLATSPVLPSSPPPRRTRPSGLYFLLFFFRMMRAVCPPVPPCWFACAVRLNKSLSGPFFWMLILGFFSYLPPTIILALTRSFYTSPFLGDLLLVPQPFSPIVLFGTRDLPTFLSKTDNSLFAFGFHKIRRCFFDSRD